MPRRDDLESILVIGAGPIVIGQASEFDYSGTQALKALREEGYRVILINSNPATIMTDPEMADQVYIEPIQWRSIAQIIERERPDALLPTMGGQTALNTALDLVREGVLERAGVELIGASREAIDVAEDRERFKRAMTEIGLCTPHSALAHTLEEALAIQAGIGFPTVIRPSFTLGGSGGGIAYNRAEFIAIAERGLDLSPTGEILVETSLLGWKEFELEVVRDRADNCIIVCTIENVDPMGVHTGDSITVAPALTLTDKEAQRLRDQAIAVLRKVGVDTGGSNVQFAIHPKSGEIHVIEMNPRVSRSSALASKATGFPIARVAAKLAVGYTLDELRNEITAGRTPASFEPTIDYVVTKIPRFNFEKFPEASDRLTTQMRAVGEVMAIGRSFAESFQKALRGLEAGFDGLNERIPQGPVGPDDRERLENEMRFPGPERLWYVADALRHGWSLTEVAALTAIDPWFLDQIQRLVGEEEIIRREGLEALTPARLRSLKRLGFSDSRLATLVGVEESAIRSQRLAAGVKPVYKRVDSCAGEFPTETAYLYSTYEEECEARPSARRKVMILGGGPNRIGQGIEFDYCCVHAVQALRADGFETIMVNCNPETVSTDYDVADRLYFEPLTLEDVLAVIELERPEGVIVQYGGQTPLKLAVPLAHAGAPLFGTPADSIDLSEDRERFQGLVAELGLTQPLNRTARSVEEARMAAESLGFPLLARPSYVLGGRAMEVIFKPAELEEYMERAKRVPQAMPVLLDRYLDHATEVDVDAVADGKQVLIGGIMEHVEQAGVHSGDSACSLPPHELSSALQESLEQQVILLAGRLGVQGLMNVQFAIQDGEIYLIEVNPRASRTVPFVSKATGRPLAKIAARVMAGVSLAQQGYRASFIPRHYAVKMPVFPFVKFQGSDPILGPEMKSTGEVMGYGDSFAEAYAKAQLATGVVPPEAGTALISVRDADKPQAVVLARGLVDRGFRLVATRHTAEALRSAGLDCAMVNKVREGRPHVVDLIINREIALIVNTTQGREAVLESRSIRREAIHQKITYYTSVEAAHAMLTAWGHTQDFKVRPIRDWLGGGKGN
ncbi:carbamoyl-phosphate synthase large subunit [mine drainage metagenome]|uniref:Ammonium-dependent carbamoyl phosphate synthetase n=2 Tax=mine drainage metagenome TaxID=410659 RepID=T1B5D7_9ZZZZ